MDPILLLEKVIKEYKQLRIEYAKQERDELEQLHRFDSGTLVLVEKGITLKGQRGRNTWRENREKPKNRLNLKEINKLST